MAAVGDMSWVNAQYEGESVEEGWGRGGLGGRSPLDQRRRQGGGGHAAMCCLGELAGKGSWGNEALNKLMVPI